jgi:hypothetical protein
MLGPSVTMWAMNELEQSLVRWAQAGLLTEEQAQHIRAFEQQSLPVTDDFGVSVAEPVRDFSVAGSESAKDDKPDRSAIAMEAIAYVGGILFVIGYGVVTGSQWGNMNNVGHFLVALAPATITFVAGVGFGVHTVPSFKRIGYVLWALSTIFFGFAVGVAVDGFFNFDDNVEAVTIAGLVMAYANGQYVARRSALQQLISFVFIAGFTCSVLALIDNSISGFWFGLLVVVQGLAWLLFTWAEAVRPRRDGFIQGGGATLLATQFMAFFMTGEAIILGIVLSILFLVIGVVGRVTPLFALGALGLFAFSILLIIGILVLGGVVVRLQLLKTKS